MTARKPRALRVGTQKVWPKRLLPIARLRRNGLPVPAPERIARRVVRCE